MAFTPAQKEILILVVDDSAPIRRVVKNTLSTLGFRKVVEADNGQTAWEMLQSDDIKLVISDWNMPMMAGIDLLKAVRSNDRLKTVPFLMLTTSAEKNNVLEAMRAGVSNYILKPFTTDQFEAKLATVFQPKGGS